MGARVAVGYGRSWDMGLGEDVPGGILPKDEGMLHGQVMGKAFHHSRAAGTKTGRPEVSRPNKIALWGTVWLCPKRCARRGLAKVGLRPAGTSIRSVITALWSLSISGNAVKNFNGVGSE